MSAAETKFSLVIPFYNEEDNVGILHQEIISVLHDFEYELVYVNDGSNDNTRAKIKEETKKLPAPYAKIIDVPGNLGQSFAFKLGMDNARFPLVVFMDGDLQNDPRDIPVLVEKFNQGYDLVQGVRAKRKDPLFRKIVPSLAANLILRVFCGSKFRDIGCSLKIFKKSLAAEIIFQHGMHRVLPVYFCLKGAKVAEIRVGHRPRIHGKTKYGFYRTLEVIFEIIKINFFEKNSNRFIFFTVFLSCLFFAYGIINSILKLPRYSEEAAVYFIISILSFYIFVISAVLYMSKSFYRYYKNISNIPGINIEIYNEKPS
jgi:glycosyltransferase involved in cell wall biosynthesis